MFIRRKYRHRHRVLKVLQGKLTPFDKVEHITKESLQMTYEEMAGELGLNEMEVLESANYLHGKSELELLWLQGKLYAVINSKGTVAFYDRKYLDEGKKEFWNNTYDVIKTVSAIIFLIIAVYTFILNIYDTRQTKKKVEQLELEIQQLKSKL